MAITRTAWIDDDGSGTTGTVINNAEKTLLYDQIDAALTNQTPKLVSDTTSGTGGVWNLAVQGNTVVEWNGTADVTFDGITAGAMGATVRIVNISTSNMYFRHLASGGGTSRLLNTVTSGLTPVSQGGSVMYLMDPVSSVWRMIQHEQGSMIIPPYNAATFSAPAGSWVVEAGDRTAHLYAVRGRQLFVELYITASTTAGAPPSLYVSVPYTFTNDSYTPAFYNDGMGYISCFVETVPNQGLLVVNKLTLATFANVTNGVYVMLMLPGASIF